LVIKEQKVLPVKLEHKVLQERKVLAVLKALKEIKALQEQVVHPVQ